jgi:hypothetical protein
MLPLFLFSANMDILCICHTEWVPKQPKLFWGEKHVHVEQAYQPIELSELLRMYRGSVTSVTFLSKTSCKVDEKLILETKQNLRSEDLNGSDKDSSLHGSPHVDLWTSVDVSECDGSKLLQNSGSHLLVHMASFPETPVSLK